jgi:hypothetical protein
MTPRRLLKELIFTTHPVVERTIAGLNVIKLTRVLVMNLTQRRRPASTGPGQQAWEEITQTMGKYSLTIMILSVQTVLIQRIRTEAQWGTFVIWNVKAPIALCLCITQRSITLTTAPIQQYTTILIQRQRKWSFNLILLQIVLYINMGLIIQKWITRHSNSHQSLRTICSRIKLNDHFLCLWMSMVVYCCIGAVVSVMLRCVMHRQSAIGAFTFQITKVPHWASVLIRWISTVWTDSIIMVREYLPIVCVISSQACWPGPVLAGLLLWVKFITRTRVSLITFSPAIVLSTTGCVVKISSFNRRLGVISHANAFLNPILLMRVDVLLSFVWLFF